MTKLVGSKLGRGFLKWVSMSSADTWTGRLFLFDRERARLDLLPRSAAMPADIGTSAFARGLVVPFSHEPLRAEEDELLELAPEAEGLALVAAAEARKTVTLKQLHARLRSRFGDRATTHAEQDLARDELLTEADTSITGHTGLFDLRLGIALLPDALARDEWIRGILLNACALTLEGLTPRLIPALLASWVLGETPIPPPFKPGRSIALESPLDRSASSFDGCLATADDIQAQIVEHRRLPVRMTLRDADIELELRDPFSVRVSIDHIGLRTLRKEASSASSAAQHRAYLQALASRLRAVLTWVVTHVSASPDTARWQHPASQRDDLLRMIGHQHDEILCHDA